MYSEQDKKFLLNLARKAIENYLNNGTTLKIKESELPSPNLAENRGCFVTLHTQDNQLRGCIGVIVAEAPLYKNIIDYAITAATRDPRFKPVTKDELNDLHLEISAMGPIEPIEDFNKIEIGKHGLIIKNGYNQGLLLPQVATEWDWDKKTFLENTCLKAGLPRDAYQWPETSVSYFSAEVFN